MDKITRQATSDKEFLFLLGVCQWVFNSNVGFIIEMIDKEHHNNSDEPWSTLIKMTAGNLKDYKNKIVTILGNDTYNLFSDLVEMRNSIFHSLPTGEKVDSYVIPIYRKNSESECVRIDKKYLHNFIKKNELLADLIHEFRGY